MDNTVTISMARYERLIAAEFALRVLAERRYQSDRQDVLDAIRTTGQLSAETEASLKAALESFTRDFLKSK